MQPYRVSARAHPSRERSLLHVRISTWLLVVFNLAMFVWVRSLPRGSTLSDARGGTWIVAVSLWALFDLMLLVTWVAGWPRRCPACDFPNSGEARYSECRGCGHDWAATEACPACGAWNLPADPVCAACGTTFEGPPGRRRLLRRTSAVGSR